MSLILPNNQRNKTEMSSTQKSLCHWTATKNKDGAGTVQKTSQKLLKI
jgi:hypothetical protein